MIFSATLNHRVIKSNRPPSLHSQGDYGTTAQMGPEGPAATPAHPHLSPALCPPRPPRALILTEKMKAVRYALPQFHTLLIRKRCPCHSPCLLPYKVERRGLFLLSRAIESSQLSPLRLASPVISQLCLLLFLLHWQPPLCKDVQVCPSQIIHVSVCLSHMHTP